MFQRNLTLDLLKILLAFIIIGLHTQVLSNVSEMYNFLTADGVFRVAVPLFFVINGYYFTTVSTNKALIKWVKRILLLYAFWMLFYSYKWFRPTSFDLQEMIIIIKIILTGYYHLWYLIGTLGAAVITFVLRDKVKLGIIISIICYFLGGLIQYAGIYHMFTNPILDEIVNIDFVHRNFLFFAFPFFYMGYLIKKEQLFQAYRTSTLWFAFILGLGLLLVESFYNYKNTLYGDHFDNYFSLIVIVSAIFLLVNRSKLTTENRNLTLISSAIYLIHPFWLAVLRKLEMADPIWMTITCILLSFLSAYVLILIQKRIKFIL
jgi:surface polysaccharide O-acyltransferase-like enzyme